MKKLIVMVILLITQLGLADQKCDPDYAGGFTCRDTNASSGGFWGGFAQGINQSRTLQQQQEIADSQARLNNALAQQLENQRPAPAPQENIETQEMAQEHYQPIAAEQDRRDHPEKYAAKPSNRALLNVSLIP